MAKDKPDDYEAVRSVVATLEPFDVNDRERILRWAREKLGLAAGTSTAPSHPETRQPREAGDGAAPATPASKSIDIKSFIDGKKPQSDSQFAAAVAYYYRFDAPEPRRKDAIAATDLQEACRQTGRDRMRNPGQTLVNAHHQGYLDKGSERGTYVVNTVGENLIAMALPEGAKTGEQLNSKPTQIATKTEGQQKEAAMTGAMTALQAAITEAGRLERILKDGRPRVQVTLIDERATAKSTALAWFDHKQAVLDSMNGADTARIDDGYKNILESSERAGARSKYLSTLKSIKTELIRLRSECAAMPAAPTRTGDAPPDFAPLISDAAMQKILSARWHECTKCIGADAPLAATVMMGGLLEALLLARINRETDKKSIFTAKAAPKDRAQKTKPLSEWMLKDYIDVVHELGWITVSAKDVGAVLRDYRNYIHPQKQLSHGVHLKLDDASLFWEISKSISRQVIDSAK